MKKLSFAICLLMSITFGAAAQVLKGHVYDSETREPLVGANITYTVRGEIRGANTDAKGAYTLPLSSGGWSLLASYMGYEDQVFSIVINVGEELTKDIYMKTSSSLMSDVVVSVGRFEQPLNEVTVSMDILKPIDIERQTTRSVADVLKTLPSVDINDNQPSIRSGSGWTYGVGARSLILVDGTSILDPGNGAINWNAISMGNIEQIEVIKGASSVLYGSSALNGLINIRTARPGLVPETRLKVFSGFYDNPDNDSYRWWNKDFWKDDKYPVEPFMRKIFFTGVRNPMYEGIEFLHTRRIGPYDVSLAMNFMTDEGYRQQDYDKRINVSGNLTYHQPGDNTVSYGASLNFLSNKYGDFFLWRSPKEAYRPSPVTNMGREENTLKVDPFYNYTNPRTNISHKVKGRFYYVGSNIVSSSGGTSSILEILGNMGTDLNTINDIAGGDYTVLLPLLEPLLNSISDISVITDAISSGDFTGLLAALAPLLQDQANLNGLINGAVDALGSVFPTATTADYMDLISWLVKNGLPDGLLATITSGTATDGLLSDLLPWLGSVTNPKEAEVSIDKTYNYYLDYQFSKKYENAMITAGATYEHTTNNSSVTGTHNADNIAVFVQYDQKFFDRLNLSLGLRNEYYRVNTHRKEAETKIFGTKVPFKPVLRAGLNYQLADYSFIRASFGQGYRYPSLTEKFARKDIGGIGVFPNHDLTAERGYNAELGFKQGYKVGSFQGFLDVAGFYTEYKDMIEFRMGFFNNSTFEYVGSSAQLFAMIAQGGTPGIGAQFYNVDKAQIYGIDLSTTGIWKISPYLNMTYNVGYVYSEPRDANYKEKNALEDTYTDPLMMKEKSNPSKYLKYRQKHTVKGTFDFEWSRFSIGTNMSWKTRMLAVDYFFVDERERPDGQYRVMDYVRDLLFGNVGGENLASYWKRMNKDYFLMDLRTSVKATEKLKFQFMVNNLLNKEYSTRPMAVAAPRTYVVQVGFTL